MMKSAINSNRNTPSYNHQATFDLSDSTHLSTHFHSFHRPLGRSHLLGYSHALRDCAFDQQNEGSKKAISTEYCNMYTKNETLVDYSIYSFWSQYGY